MNFQIMQHMGGKEFVPALHDITKKPLIFDDPKKAAEVAANLTAAKGVKFQPRPIKDIADLFDWRVREQMRFKNGEYIPVVWAGQPWWKEIPDHFAHVGVKDKTRIAYTPDAEKGAADLQVSTTPGKYLQKFFGDKMTPKEIRDYAMEHSLKYDERELKFATTPEEIQEVYAAPLGGSCFTGTTNANLYGSGDFAVAYIEDNYGKITGRCICVPERKIFVEPYGDEARLNHLLKEQGYKKVYDGHEFVGLRLVKKHFWRGWYPDWGHGGRGHKPHPTDKDFYIVCEG